MIPPPNRTLTRTLAVHRFRDTVVLNSDRSDYMSAQDALELAAQLTHYAKTITDKQAFSNHTTLTNTKAVHGYPTYLGAEWKAQEQAAEKDKQTLDKRVASIRKNQYLVGSPRDAMIWLVQAKRYDCVARLSALLQSEQLRYNGDLSVILDKLDAEGLLLVGPLSEIINEADEQINNHGRTYD